MTPRQGNGTRACSFMNSCADFTCWPTNGTEVCPGLRSHQDTRARELLENLKYIPLTWQVAWVAGLLKRGYGRKGITLAAVVRVMGRIRKLRWRMRSG